MRDYAEWKNLLPIAADVVGARKRDVSSNARMYREEKHFTNCRGFRRGDPTWSPGNVTFHPMRDRVERKNILPSAADVVGARRICSVFL